MDVKSGKKRLPRVLEKFISSYPGSIPGFIDWDGAKQLMEVEFVDDTVQNF